MYIGIDKECIGFRVSSSKITWNLKSGVMQNHMGIHSDVIKSRGF